MAEILINDDNWQEHAGENGQLHENSPHSGGETRLMGCHPKPVGADTGFMKSMAQMATIPRSEWQDRIKYQEENKTRVSDICDRAKIPCLDQDGISYCHANSAAYGVMICRAVMNLPTVYISPGSIGGPITDYNNEGAWIGQDLKQICTVGAATVDYVPPNQVSRSGWKSGADENCKLHRVTEWWDLGDKDDTMFDRCATLVLSGFPVCVGYNWWGHAVTLLDLVYTKNKRYGFRFWNSWGLSYGENGRGILEEGKGTPDQAYCPRQVTISDE